MQLDEDRSRKAQQGFGIREHSDDIGTPLDLFNDSVRSFGIRNSRSPAVVASSNCLDPLPVDARPDVRSQKPAPITPSASASINA